MLPNIATGDGINDFAVEMRIFVVGDYMEDWETHRLVFQHVNARSSDRDREKGREKGLTEKSKERKRKV